MPERAIRFRVLIASPSDCQEERLAIADALRRWNEIYGSRRGLELQPSLWEENAQPELGDRAQGILNKQLVDRADILIAVFWKRLGTATSVAPSGTVEEINRFLENGRPALVYFSKRPTDLRDVDPEQLTALRAYRHKIEQLGLIGEFATVAELHERVQKHLDILIDKLPTSESPLGTSHFSKRERQKIQEGLDATQLSREQRYAFKSPDDSDYQHVFEPLDSVSFYNQIAARYDARQSDELLDAQYSSITVLRRSLAGRPRPRVLDLGGGTGSEIATHFAPRDDLKWLYVDASPSMLQQFYHNTRRARMQTTVMLGSADKQAESLLEDGYRFDAIIMSWLLSSVTTNIRFETLGGLLKKDGCLVITDADPENLRNQPLYGIDLGQVRIALRLRPVEPKQLEAAATSAGLELNETTPILKRDGSKYAFVQVYRALPADAPAGK